MTNRGFRNGAGLLILMLLMVACASGASRSLLKDDYVAMTDQELVVYYDQLNEAIAKEEGGAGGFGLGLGLGVGSGSFSLGASQGMYVDDPTEELRVRRNQVRLEMARRGLEPAQTKP
ncbi:hypothetical protein Pcar_0196 [Syntrophotalea carbinolica DSM 2380]|uniref:Uncharacterized protein n=1 Tax=Syntrophotalea carbinolica (strain DSM 2380 / NBRC 103641 / GraBd1) TaxID=338963 RepID=Q3A835_SYNC1|nr:hypothetical protein [Syntrophotalea carbinolica]ABA87457.1 hypothetical protein Pcar_0196 [Syntrophotalea carbinolica DSM 2380]